jgi:prepilin-type N-terminal cleavage/methylation domain-containing protein
MHALSHTHQNRTPRPSDRLCAGFTLSELMMAIAVFGLVMAGAVGTFATVDASCQASTVLSRIAYGVGDNCGLRAAFKPVSATTDNTGWTITYTVPAGMSGTATDVNQLRYDAAARTISYQGGANTSWSVIGKNVIASAITPSSSDVSVMIRAEAIVGDCTTRSEMTSTIAFRNES